MICSWNRLSRFWKLSPRLVLWICYSVLNAITIRLDLRQSFRRQSEASYPFQEYDEKRNKQSIAMVALHHGLVASQKAIVEVQQSPTPMLLCLLRQYKKQKTKMVPREHSLTFFLRWEPNTQHLPQRAFLTMLMSVAECSNIVLFPTNKVTIRREMFQLIGLST